MSAEVTRTWAGRPSRIATSEGPWDSPAVSQRSMAPVFHAPRRPQTGASVPETCRDRGAEGDAHDGADEHEGAEREALAVHHSQAGEHQAPQPADQEGAVEPDQQRRPAEVAQREAEDARQPDV